MTDLGVELGRFAWLIFLKIQLIIKAKVNI